MGYGDIYLVYELLETAINKKRFDLSAHLARFGNTRAQAVKCVGLLWQQGLIRAPTATLRQDGIVISLAGGVTEAGRSVHELLNKTLWEDHSDEAEEGDCLPRPSFRLIVGGR